MQVSFGHEGNLRMMLEQLSPSMPILHGGGGDHVEGQIGATSMKMVLDSVVGLTPDLQLRMRHRRAVMGHEVGSDRSAVREREVFLRSC